jgi:hypothetical protein
MNVGSFNNGLPVRIRFCTRFGVIRANSFIILPEPEFS